MKSLLFAMPGTPVLYYGDEIGMGDNIFLGDRDGVRTPMQWSADRNAGFSQANSQRLYLPVNIDPEYHYEAINVEAQQNNPHSLLWWMKRMIALRKRHKALSRGSIEFLLPENTKVLAFLRCHQEECILVVNNLSRFVQYVELDLSAHQGLVPREVFAQTAFPAIGEHPYMLTLGPHSTYWFSLEEPPPAEIQLTPREAQIPTFSLTGPAEELFRSKNRQNLGDLLPPYLTRCRWFGGKARNIKAATITEVIPFPYGASVAYFTLVRVAYVEGEPETYVLPLAVAFGERAAQVQEEFPQAVVARLRGPGQEGLLYEAVGKAAYIKPSLQSIAHRRHFKGEGWRADRQPHQGISPYPVLDEALSLFRHHEGRAEQYLHRLQRLVHPEAHAPGRRRGESGLGNRSLSHRTILFCPQPPGGRSFGVPPHPWAAHHPGHPPRLCAQSGRCLEIHPGRPGHLL